MRTRLIWPPTTIYGDDTSVPPVVQPLGLAYLAAWLEKEGHDVSILDGRGSRHGKRSKNCFMIHSNAENAL